MMNVGGKNNKQGSVEIQTSGFRRHHWKIPEFGKRQDELQDGDPLYCEMEYGTGHIWCIDGRTTTDVVGSDRVTLDFPLLHGHPDTRAETTTRSIPKDKGGGSIENNYTIGYSSLVSKGGYSMQTGKTVRPIAQNFALSDDEMTYPLYGQNVIDFRTRTHSHNNVPPSLNVYVRYGGASRSALSTMSKRGGVPEDNFSIAKYHSLMVPELDDYAEPALTPSDCLLRMSLDGTQEGGVVINRQTVQMLLDIFTQQISESLQVDGLSIQELLYPFLDRELVVKNEFMNWYAATIERLNSIQDKIKTVQELSISVPPINYRGRVIISYTDDTEQKVINHYGGRKWRRITNFLRGVEKDSLEIGRKFGEEYVCLRESNVPLHVHGTTLVSDEQMGSEKWFNSNKPGDDVKIVNENPTGQDEQSNSLNAGNSPIEYQMGQLERQTASQITMPHDNMPPFMETFMWECIEPTEFEMSISGETQSELCQVTWIHGNGTDVSTNMVERGSRISDILPEDPTWSGRDFTGWIELISRKPLDPASTIEREMTFEAQWKMKTVNVVFHREDGVWDDGSQGSTKTI